MGIVRPHHRCRCRCRCRPFQARLAVKNIALTPQARTRAHHVQGWDMESATYPRLARPKIRGWKCPLLATAFPGASSGSSSVQSRTTYLIHTYRGQLGYGYIDIHPWIFARSIRGFYRGYRGFISINTGQSWPGLR